MNNKIANPDDYCEPSYVYEDAMILWEAVLNDLPRFEPYQSAHGAAQLRCKMVEFIPYILRDWYDAEEENKDMHDTYDWDYLPYWIANFLEVTDSNIEYRRNDEVQS